MEGHYGQLSLEERFLYAQIRRSWDTDWRNYLPRRKYKRGYRRPGKDTSALRLIPQRVQALGRLKAFVED